VSGEFRISSGKNVKRLRIELSVSDRKGVDIEEEKRGMLLEVDIET